MNYGYLPPTIQIGEDYVFGSFISPTPKDILQSDGDWTPYLPVDEFQNLNGIEPQSCTCFGTLSAVEILIKRKYGHDKNYSDRWLAKYAGIDPTKGGGNPHTVAETLRKKGSPYQEKWDVTPDVTTVEGYYQDPPRSLETEARRDFIDQYTFLHEYVGPSKEQVLQALKLSPLGVSVAAWFEQDGVYYKPTGMNENHWCVCYGYDAEKDAWRIFDSYDNSRKLYKGMFGTIKRYHVDKPLPKKRCFLGIMQNIFK